MEAASNGVARNYLLPSLPQTHYAVDVATGGLELHFPPDATERLNARRHQFLEYPAFLESLHEDGRKFRVELSDGNTITPLLRAEGSKGKRLAKDLRVLERFGLGVDNKAFQDLASLLDMPAPVPDTPWYPTVAEVSPAIGIVLHLHYRDLWSEFETALRRQTRPFRLLVTLTEDDGPLKTRISRSFPNSEIHIVENRGRDVGPFFHLINSGRLDTFEYICKLHGKKTIRDGDCSVLGELWRRINIDELIGSAEQVDRIIGQFQKNPGIGMIGARQFRLPRRDTYPEEECYGEDKSGCLSLAQKLNLSSSELKLDFFAGTMFWMRRDLLDPLRRLGLSTADFPPEPCLNGGQLPHAMERFFGIVTLATGLLLCNTPGTAGTNS